MSHPAGIAALARALRDGSTTAPALLEHRLDRVAEQDPALGAFRRLCPDRARDEAAAAQARIEGGRDLGPLDGIPFAVKDLFDVRGLPTTAGTRLLEDHRAAADSEAVRRLAAAGMVLVGKTNTVQFAYGGVGVNHDHGTPRNPWAAEPHVPGGSSSGSAVAVASGLVPAALGTDTGGSVRVPAALCGITGLKTTVGRVSRTGVFPLSWSLDSVGPLARDADDAALLYDALQGPDPADPSTAAAPPVERCAGDAVEADLRGLRVQVAQGVFWEDCDPEVAAAVRDAARVFAGLGAVVEEAPFPEAGRARDLNPRGLVIAAEAYTLNRRWIEGHFDALDPVVAHRMRAGADVPAHEYLASVRAWEALRARTRERLARVDLLLCPTTAIPARPVAVADADPESYRDHNLLYLRNTAIGNILGLCGLSVPCGLTGAGLPVGLMIYGRPFDERAVLRAGRAFQRATGWHLADAPHAGA